MGGHVLLRGILSTQGSNPRLLSLAWTDEFFSIEPPGEPKYYVHTVNVFINIYSVF